MPSVPGQRRNPVKKPAHGGARKGAGRHPRQTQPVTVRLHALTLGCFTGRNRSADIERVLLDYLVKSYTSLRGQSPVYASRLIELKKLRALLATQNRAG